MISSGHKDGRKIFNVLHVISRLPVGGVENMLLKVVTRYDRKSFNPVVCCMKEGGEIADEIERSGIRVYRLNRMRRHGFDRHLIKDIYHIIRKEDIHILRTHQYHAGLYGRIAGILAGISVIIPSFHNLYVSPDRPKFHRRIVNNLLGRFSDSIVAVAETVKADIERYDRIPTQKIKIINNGIDLAEFTTELTKEDARRILDLPHDGVLVGSVGRLTVQKDHHTLIKAASGMDDIHIVIAGDGPLKGELVDLAHSLNVNLQLTGKLERTRIPVFHKAIDLFCFPSLWEGMPSALIEAMASGNPVIASGINVHRDLIENAGLFFDSGDDVMLSREIKQIISDSAFAERLGAAARERAMIYSIEETVQKYERLFLDTLQEKGIL